MNENLKKVISISSSSLGGVTGAIFGGAVGGPIGAAGGAALAPFMVEAFKKVGNSIAESLLSDRQAKRIGETYSLAATDIKEKLEAGNQPRNDDFFTEDSNNRSKATSILEGTLLKARDEYEEKKLIFYSRLLSNITFETNITFERADTLLRLIEQLSYRQLGILAYCQKNSLLNMNGWIVKFKDNEHVAQYMDFYSEIMSLYNFQLLQQAGVGVSLGIGNLKLSSLGQTLCQLMELNIIDHSVIENIADTINIINSK